MIPAAAVEAAWVRFQYLTITRDEIRGILEAAAPFMEAAALERAASSLADSLDRLEDLRRPPQ